MEKTLFNEEIKSIFNSNYKNTLFLESLKYKKELTLAEAVHVLASCDEQVLNEAMFSKMGGLVDKALETIGNKLLGAKDAIVNWVITSLGGQVQKKEQPTPFDGAKTIVPVAQMAKKDPEGFFQKVATMTGNTAAGIKSLYMKLEGLYEKIPLVGKIASKIPKGWRTVIIALIVVVVAGAVIWKEKTGAGGAPKAPEVAPKAPEVAPKAPEVAPKAPEAASTAVDATGNLAKVGEKTVGLVGKIAGSSDQLTKYAQDPEAYTEKLLKSLEKYGITKDTPMQKLVAGSKGNMDFGSWLQHQLSGAAVKAGLMSGGAAAQQGANAGFDSLDSKLAGK